MASTLELSRIRAPSHRHAAPCGPWPWVDLDDEIQPASLQAPGNVPKCPHPTGQCVGCWAGYPQCLFPNWTAAQVLQSKMFSHPAKSDLCVIYRVEVTDDGKCYDPGSLRAQGEDGFWKLLQDSVGTFPSAFLKVLMRTFRDAQRMFVFEPCSSNTFQCQCCRCWGSSHSMSTLTSY